MAKLVRRRIDGSKNYSGAIHKYLRYFLPNSGTFFEVRASCLLNPELFHIET